MIRRQIGIKTGKWVSQKPQTLHGGVKLQEAKLHNTRQDSNRTAQRHHIKSPTRTGNGAKAVSDYRTVSTSSITWSIADVVHRVCSPNEINSIFAPLIHHWPAAL